MKDIKNSPLRDHSFDGIQEYDNPMPTWWLATFFATIIFGFIYWVHYEFGGGITQWAEVENDLAKISSTKKPEKTWSEKDFSDLLNSQNDLANGKAAFDAKCSACHGKSLEGLIGPNLTDNYWIHGKGKGTDMIQVILKGVVEKGMPPWEGLIPDQDMKQIVAYIISKKGSQPAGAKAPQGVEVAE